MPGDDIIPGRYYIKFQCTENPDHTWISFIGKSGKKKINKRKCRVEGVKAQVIELRELLESDIPDGIRLWGAFTCGNCGRKWSSGKAWKGYTQDCQLCNTAVLTLCLRFLLRGRGVTNKHHLNGLCGKCKESGHACC